MTLLIICAVVVGVICFLAILPDGLGEAIGCAIPAAVVGAFCAFVIGLIVGTIAYSGHHWAETHRVTLVSVADGSDTHGDFFLGSGSVDSSPAYIWYERSNANSYVRKDVDASEATIHYVAKGTAPYYTVTENKPDHGFVNSWGFNMDDYVDGERYDFYVPRGSIVQSYRLDNK
jgi:hypothetical protein